MKKLIILAALILSISSVFAQSKEEKRTISVTGVAESEVTPDIINVSISLQEYMDGKNRVAIATLESQLVKAVKDAGIPATDFTVSDVTAWRDYYEKKKMSNFFASKQYNIRVHNLDKYNQILEALNSKGVESTEVQSYDYSKITELKRDLKIQALLAAKNKANYMLEAIDEKLGRVLTINESNPVTGYFSVPQFANSIAGSSNSNDSAIGYKKIKLSFEVQAVFEIK
jgi:uncharacterized protein YggE